MRDPEPGNIEGSKVQKHVFKHEINWGYVAVALAILTGLWMLRGRIEQPDENNEDPSFGREAQLTD